VSVLAAAAINSMAELAAADRIRKPGVAARTAAVAALGGYAAWRRGLGITRIQRRRLT
jgi:hypothetical protein